MLDRNQIPFDESTEVFQPVMAASSHHHGMENYSNILICGNLILIVNSKNQIG